MTLDSIRGLTNLFVDHNGSAPQQFKGFIGDKKGGITLPDNSEQHPSKGVVHTWRLEPKDSNVEILSLNVVFSDGGAISVGIDPDDAMAQSRTTQRLYGINDTMSQGVAPSPKAQAAIDRFKERLSL